MVYVGGAKAFDTDGVEEFDDGIRGTTPDSLKSPDYDAVEGLGRGDVKGFDVTGFDKGEVKESEDGVKSSIMTGSKGLVVSMSLIVYPSRSQQRSRPTLSPDIAPRKRHCLKQERASDKQPKCETAQVLSTVMDLSPLWSSEPSDSQMPLKLNLSS